MPFVRCKFYYQDTGAPVGSGCRKGIDCDFVHPSSPDWPDAPLPRQHVTEARDGGNNRNGDRRGSGRGWGDRNAGSESSNPRGRRDSGWSSSSVVTGANRAGPSRSSPIPTGPRAMQAGKASGSGWGSAPLGGTAWSASETRKTTQTTNAATPSSTSADTWVAANDTSWGAPTGGGWGAPTSGGWGEPTADGGSGWGEPTADAGWGDTAVSASTSAPPSAPAIPPPPPPTSAAPPAAASVSQQSPTRENAESIIWGDRKGKGREVVGMGTPQYGFTPRTPRSPNRSPERDPRRQVSSTFAAPSMTPTDYVAVASTVSKEMRQERDGVRMISSGIYVPKAWAGDGTATSSSNKNPFAFPTYYSPEKMAVDRHVHQEGAVLDVDFDLSRSLYIDHDVDLPLSSRDQWKDYTRALASAICSNIDIRRLQETRAKVKRLHNSKMYASASQVAAHARLQELDDQASAELQEARSKYDTAIKHLMRYPLDGLPAPSDNDPRLKDAENVGGYVEDMKRWKAQIKESVDSFEEKIRQVEAEQRRVKEETLRLEEEQKQAVAAVEAEAEKLRAAQKWVPINSTRKAMSDIEETFAKLEERVTDLEYDFMDMREATPATGDVVLQRLIELGYCKPTEAQTVQLLERQLSLEEGEMPFVPPTPPKSNEELTEECEKIGKRLEDHIAVLARSQQQLKELQERRITRDRSYHELAADNSHLVLTMKALEDEQREHADLLAQTDKDIAHLEQLLEQCKKDRSPPPPPPTSEEITAEVLKNILPELRSVVKQALGKIKTGVDDALLKQQEVVCGQIATTLQPAMVIARTFGTFMERQPDVVMPAPPPPVQPTQSV